MSQKYLYTNTGDDFLAHQEMNADSYQRQSNAYRPSVRSSSQEQQCSTTSSSRTVDSTVHLPGMALSFLHSCGLDPSDLAHLAELPEHLITVETLPKLLLQVKERKLSSTSSSRPLTCQPLEDTSTHAWEGSSHPKPVEYPIDPTYISSVPSSSRASSNLAGPLGNPRQMTSLPTDPSDSSSKSNTVPDYSISMDTDQYCDATESPEASSRSFVDFGPRPLLSLKLEPPVIVPTRREALDFNCRIPPAFPHVCCLCDISVRSRKDWFLHVQSHEHAKIQLELCKSKYPKWDQTVDSTRKAVTSKVYKVPNRKEASDFNGIVPPVFPYICVLCNITVFSEIDWSVHVTGGQHAKSQLDLMGRYPEWDGTVRSSRRNDDHSSTDGRDGTSKENTSDLKKSQVKNESSLVVSFTPLPAGDGIPSKLTAIAQCFGSLKKSLFMPNRGYVEMSCLAEAKELVEHYSVNQLKLKGKLIHVNFSCVYTSLSEAEGKRRRTKARRSRAHRRSNQVKHSIQRDPSLEQTHSSPKRRHSSERTYSSRGRHIKEQEDSSPKRKRSSERAHSSPKRKRSSERTHSSPKRRQSSERTHSSPKRRQSSERTHSSPKSKRSSERTHSSPKRRQSSERTHSSPKSKRSSETTHSSPKRKCSSERPHSSPKRRPSSERTHSSPKRTQSLEATRSSPKGKCSSERTHSNPKRKCSSERPHSSPKRRPPSERTHSSPKRRLSSERTHSSPKRTQSLEVTRSSPKGKCSSERTHSSPKRRRPSERTHSSPRGTESSEGSHSSPKNNRSSERTHSSPKSKRSSERTHSSPKRRQSSERTHSSPKRRQSSERTHSSPKRRQSSERTHSSPKSKHSSERTHSSRNHNVNSNERSSSAAKDKVTKSSTDIVEKKSVSNNNVESLYSDGDLEGLEVIADDGEELVHDVDDYDATKSDQENLPSEPMDRTDVHTEEQEKTGENFSNADTSEASKEIKEEDHDFPKILENCVTLDEITEEENSSDCQESDEANASSPKTEQSDESKSPKYENTSKTAADPNVSENLEDPVDQTKEEQDTQRVTDNLKETFGKVLEVRNLPSANDYADSDFLNIIKRYGDITHHVLFPSSKKGFVEMMFTSDAERVASDSTNQHIFLRGNILKIEVSQKYWHLPKEGFSVDSDDEEIKKGEISKESNNKQQTVALNGNRESSNESLKTYEPVGTEFVRPVVGYFCSLCSVIYASEEEAKAEHCRSPSHHKKVQEHKERSGYVENKK